MSVFLDANIIFSAANASSNLRRLLDFLVAKEILLSSHYALNEAERNIIAKRPQWVDGYQSLIKSITLVPESILTIDAGLPDKDKPILAAAITADCAYLVTGDKRDFGHLYGTTLEGVTVLSILEFSKVMMEKHAS